MRNLLLRSAVKAALVLLASVLRVGAQPAASAPPVAITRVGVLPDRNLTWASIHTDTTLAFAPTDSLRPAQARRYWLKLLVANRSQYAQAAQLTVLPNLDNTLYYYDEDAHAWRTRRAGVAVTTDSQRVKGGLPLALPGRAITTCYVLVRLHARATLPPVIRLQVRLEPASVTREADAFFRLAWAVSLAVVALLLVTNLLAYSRQPDRITLYYVCTQVGALLYITAFRGYFKVLWPSPIFSELVRASSLSYAYTLNNVAMHLSVVLMLVGFVQMTRAYLPTRARLPRLDAALRYGLRGYCVFAAVVGLVNVSGFYLNQYTLLYDNLLVLVLVALLLATTVAAYRQRLPLARPYLLANALPLLFILVVAAYHIVIGFYNNGNLLLPDLAIMAHALGFSVALNLRLQAVQQTLLATEREAAALALDIERQELRHREIVLKNGHIQAALLELQQRQQAHEQQAQRLSTDMQAQQQANHALQQQLATHHDLQAQLEANQRELASTSLYVQQKNALLAELQAQLRELHRQRPGAERPPALAEVQSLLQAGQHLDEDWSRFKRHFEQVHPRFFEDLQAKYPALTSHEQRLYCYFHIQLATKEIAALLNIDPASVRRAKTRLYKKIGAADQAAGRPAPAEGSTEE